MTPSLTFNWKFFKAETSKSCFQFFFSASQWFLTSKKLCPQLHMHNSHSWHRELCASIWVLKLCQNMKKKKPYKEEIHFLGWAGDFYLFIEQQSFCCGSMDVFFFVSVSVNFFLFFVWLQCKGKQKSWTNLPKILQHCNFSFLTKIAKCRAHGLCDTDLETLLAFKFYMWGIVNQRQVI